MSNKTLTRGRTSRAPDEDEETTCPEIDVVFEDQGQTWRVIPISKDAIQHFKTLSRVSYRFQGNTITLDTNKVDALILSLTGKLTLSLPAHR